MLSRPGTGLEQAPEERILCQALTGPSSARDGRLGPVRDQPPDARIHDTLRRRGQVLIFHHPANGNGLSNLLDFAYGFDPAGPGSSGALLEVSNPGPEGVITRHGGMRFWTDPETGRVFMRYARRTDHASVGLTFTHQFSRDLSTFENLPGAGEVIGSGTGDDGIPVEAVQVPLPLILPGSGGRARYGRNEVSLTP